MNPFAMLAAAIMGLLVVSCTAPPRGDLGEPVRTKALGVALRVSAYTPLKKPCLDAAVGIVEAGVARKLAGTVTELRNGDVLAATAQSHWRGLSCPDEALPGLAFGTADISNSMIFGAHRRKSVD